MRVEGNFQRDGFVIIRSLFEPDRVQRMLLVLDQLKEKHAAFSPEARP